MKPSISALSFSIFVLCFVGGVCVCVGRESFPAGSGCSENVMLDKVGIRLQPSLIASRDSSCSIRHLAAVGSRTGGKCGFRGLLGVLT